MWKLYPRPNLHYTIFCGIISEYNKVWNIISCIFLFCYSAISSVSLTFVYCIKLYISIIFLIIVLHTKRHSDMFRVIILSMRTKFCGPSLLRHQLEISILLFKMLIDLRNQQPSHHPSVLYILIARWSVWFHTNAWHHTKLDILANKDRELRMRSLYTICNYLIEYMHDNYT